MRQRQIQTFSTSGTEQEALTELLLGKPYVCFIEDGQYIDWNTLSPVPPTPPGPTPYSAQNLTFDVKSAGTITWKMTNKTSPKTIQYKLNDGEWTNITSTTGTGAVINVEAGDKVQFRGDNSAYATKNNESGVFSINYFGSTAKFNIYGNIKSLVDSTGFTGTTGISNSAFAYLFTGNTGLVSASNLILPDMVLSNDCYYGMFNNCENLTGAPALPATTLAQNCYSFMFRGCVKLRRAPVLPAADVPLMAYSNMFYYCERLNYIKCLATALHTSGEQKSTWGWTGLVADTGTFVKAAGMNDWTTGTDGIPTGWTVQDAE